MKTLLPLAIAFSVCAVSAQDLSQKVTFTSTAAPTSRVVADLAAQTGVKLEVSPAQNRDVLVVRVENVELRTLMDQIAKATTGEWKEDNGVWRLGKDTAKQIAEERAELTARTAALRKAIKAMQDQHKATPEPKADVATEGDMAMALPQRSGMLGNKALIDLLARLDLAAIAALERDGRLVFATNPTRMQKPLSIDAATVAAIVKDHNESVRAAKEAEASVAKTEEQKQMEEMLSNWMPGFRNRQEPIETPPSKVMLIVARAGMWEGTTATLRMFDARGQVIYEETTPIPLGTSWFQGLEDIEVGPDGKVTQKQKTPGEDEGPEIKLSPVAQEMTTMFTRYYGPGAEEPKLSPELAERLASPEKYDPLSFEVAESILAVAEAKKLNVVANVPDSIAGSFLQMFTSGSKSTVGGYFERLKDGSGTTATVENGWMIVRPKEPAAARKDRLDRSALTRLIAACAGKEVPALDDLAAYAREANDPQTTPIAMPYIANFAANALQGGMTGFLSWDMLRLYGTLSAGQRQTLASGSRLTFGSLTPSQTAIVTKMAFGASARLRVDRPGAKPKEDEGFMEMMRFMRPDTGIDFRDEPTEVMPNGLPGGGSIEMKSMADNFVLVVGQKGGDVKQYGALGIDELAILRYFSEDPNMQQVANQIPRFEKFRLGERTAMDFTFRLAPDVSIEHSLRDDRMGKDAPVVGEDGFPAAFKARIDKRIAALKKSPFPMFGMGQAVPPP
jgi:hypothetical protein